MITNLLSPRSPWILSAALLPLACSAPDGLEQSDSGPAGQDESGSVGLDLSSYQTEQACFTGAAPSGSSCSCVYSDCEGCEVECICSDTCFDDRDDCLITSQSDVVNVNDSAFEGWGFVCEYQEAGGSREFPIPARMVCDGAPEVCTPPTVSDPPGRPVSTEACPISVPGSFTLSEPVWGEFDVDFFVPFPEYALAVAHASRSLETSDYPLRLAPSFFLATSLKESYLGCSNDLLPWQAGLEGIVYRGAQSVDIDGCYQIESTTAWTELCRMYPDTLNCSDGHAILISSAQQDSLGRDNFVSSTHAAAYYYVWSFAFSQMYEGINDLFAWFDTAADPYATEKLAAALYNRGAWGGIATNVVENCHDTLIEQCESGAYDYVRQVGAYTREMEAQVAAENCYNEVIDVSVVENYVRQLVPLYPGENLDGVLAAAKAAFTEAAGGISEAPFQQVAGPVIEAIEGALTVQVHCPEAGLNEYYVLWGETWECP